MFRLFNELQKDKNLLAIFLGVAFIMCSSSFVQVVLPLYLRSDFSANYLMVNLLTTVFAIARLCTNIPISMVMDRVGRKKIMMTGPLLIFISLFLSGLASSYQHFLILRILEGLGSAIFVTTAITTIADIAPDGHRGSYMGWYLTGLHVGVTVGPVLGGIVSELLGFRAPFIIGSVIALFATLIINYQFQKIEDPVVIHNSHSAPSQKPSATLISTFRDRDVAIIVLIGFCLFFVRTGILQGLFPLFANEVVNLNTALIGTITTLRSWVSTLILFFGRRLSDRYGRKRVLILGLASYSFGMFVTAYANSFSQLLLTSLLIGFATSILGPIPVAFLGDKVTKERRGQIIALHRTISDIGMIVGPLAMGWVSDVYALTVPFVLGSIYLIVMMILCFTLKAS